MHDIIDSIFAKSTLVCYIGQKDKHSKCFRILKKETPDKSFYQLDESKIFFGFILFWSLLTYSFQSTPDSIIDTAKNIAKQRGKG